MTYFASIRLPFKLTQTRLIPVVTCFIMSLHNFAFFKNFFETYSDSEKFYQQALSVAIFHSCLLILLFSLFGVGRFLKFSLAIILIISSMAAYFIDSYNVVIDANMIENLLETDTNEIRDLLSTKLYLYLIFLGVIPAYVLARLELAEERLKFVLLKRIALMVISLLIALGTLYVSSDFFASYFREHKILRYYSNPTTPIYSSIRFGMDKLKTSTPLELSKIGTDALIPKLDKENELIVLVVGETARSDHFSLNGYKRKTNPLLEKENLISFINVSSCGTSTATSVPCMFSFLTHEEYDSDQAATTENILDILKRAGIQVLWRDNNSSSKGVADRVEYQNFKTPDLNTICNPECRDEGMLIGLNEWITQYPNRDILIVLHQMGSHGPAYYKRYPDRFYQFKNACQSVQLEDCSQQEIVNAYDNTILYTDYFLSKVINWLKQQSFQYEVSMLYFSDHGESLGEKGLYLHGFPYALAPEAQKNIPAIIWSAENNNDIDMESVRKKIIQPISHDNLVHTLMGMFEIDSNIYRRQDDILEYLHQYH